MHDMSPEVVEDPTEGSVTLQASGAENTSETAFQQRHAVPISTTSACWSWSVASYPASHHKFNTAPLTHMKLTDVKTRG